MAWMLKMRMPGEFNVGWRVVPTMFDTRDAARAAAERFTSGSLAGWDVLIQPSLALHATGRRRRGFTARQ